MSELYHHGVKGMRWGVRRFRRTTGTRISSKSKGHISPIQNYRNKKRAKTINMASMKLDSAANLNKKAAKVAKKYGNYGMQKQYESEAKRLITTKKSLMNTPIDKLSKSDLKTAKQWADMNIVVDTNGYTLKELGL